MAARNRPRSGFARDDNADENALWLSIVDKIRKCRDARAEYEQTQAAIEVAKAKIGDGEATPESIAALEEMEDLYRQGLKAAEEELKILQEDPDDLLKNLETLISVRSAFESETPRAAPNGKSRNFKRRLDTDAPAVEPAASTPQDVGTPTAASRIISKTASRSGSVAAASVKSEDRAEPVEVPGYKDRFSVGSDVFYKTKKNQEGEGILCKIISVVGEGKSKKYEIQDSDPEPDAAHEPAWKVSAAHLVPIPPTSNGLPMLPKNKQVLAVYPQTTTFYKAEMVGNRKDMMCRLRFEGEDDGATEQEVERRFVLDLR